MKQIPSIRARQRFKATPQLRHAIGLLQLSGDELRLEIQHAVESNALLEIEENNFQQFSNDVFDINVHRDNESSITDSDRPNTILFEDHDDLYAEDNSGSDRYSLPPLELPDIDRSRVDAYEVADNSVSLTDHLTWQINFASLTDTQDAIARTIIDEINNDGMLQTTLEDIAFSLHPEVNVDLVEIEKVLNIIQTLDPPGVGGRNLQECLLIQLQMLSDDTNSKRVAIRLIADHFDVLASQDFNRLSRILSLSRNELLEAIDVVRSLNPRPGSIIGSTITEYVKPDVIVREEKDRWLVELNPRVTPLVRINPVYAQPSTSSKQFPSNNYVRENLRHAKLFLQGLEHRNSTLVNVSKCIVEHQQEYLTHGSSAMKPLTLAHIASELGIHVSTISRVTSRKYLMTPQGLLPLKYFFSNNVPTTSGEAVASTAVRELIRNAIKNEERQSPLTDNVICNLLETNGIKIARRTVAKYRGIMAIPSSNERRRAYWGDRGFGTAE